MPNERRGKPNQGREVTVSKTLSYLLRHAADREGLRMNAQGYANVADVLSYRKLKSLKVTLPEIFNVVSTSEKKRFALLHIPSARAEQEKTEATTIPPVGSSSERPEGQESEDRAVIAASSTSEGQESATEKALSVEDTDPSHFLIRATQGHSIKSVDAASFLERLSLDSTLPETVVHGTYHSAWPLILNSGGLRCMGRNHVHFATGPSLKSVLAKTGDGDGRDMEPTTDGNVQVDSGRVISGMRQDAQVLIYIDLRRALEAGFPFWRSENGVILSEGMLPEGGEESNKDKKHKAVPLVPLKFFDVVVERKRGLGVLWEHGKEVQKLPDELTSQRKGKGKA